MKVRRSKSTEVQRQIHEMKSPTKKSTGNLRLALDDSNLNTRLWSIRFPFCFNAAFAALVSYLGCDVSIYHTQHISYILYISYDMIYIKYTNI